MDASSSQPRQEESELPQPEAVFAPEVPEDVRDLLTSEPGVMVAADRPAPTPRSDLKVKPVSTLAWLVGIFLVEAFVWGIASGLLLEVLPDGLAVWLSVGLGVVGLLFFAGMIWAASTDSEVGVAAREYHSKYLQAEDWDEDARALMLRAQEAVRVVQTAEVTKRGLLDDIQNDVVLPEQLWDIGKILQRLSVLRARHLEISGGLSSAELAGVLGSRSGALRLTAEAMERKVVLLERYAEQVRETDAALRAEAALQEALHDGDGYIELLAGAESAGRTGLIQSLNEEAAELRSRLARSVAAVRETGRTLVLPSDDGRSTSMT